MARAGQDGKNMIEFIANTRSNSNARMGIFTNVFRASSSCKITSLSLRNRGRHGPHFLV